MNEDCEADLAGVEGLKIVRMDSVRDAVKGADIVATVTADKTNATIVAPGMYINAVGGDCPGKTGLHADILFPNGRTACSTRRSCRSAVAGVRAISKQYSLLQEFQRFHFVQAAGAGFACQCLQERFCYWLYALQIVQAGRQCKRAGFIVYRQ